MSEPVRAAFRQQAVWSRQLESPFTALLMEGLADGLQPTGRTGAAVLGWAGDPFKDALTLRLAGGLHALVRAGHAPALATLYPPAPLPGPGALAAALAAVLADAATDAMLLPWLASAPQTNEVGRSAVLMAGLLVIADRCRLPVRLFELGASAGLNLGLDRWRYRLGDLAFGPDAAPVRLAPLWRGDSPPRGDVRIDSRRGVDLAPLGCADPATAARLIAYVWPDQPERVARAAAAIAATALDPPTIDRADAADWVEERVTLAAGAVAVVQHSIAFQYFSPATQARIHAHLAALGATASPDAALAWLRFEADDPGATALPTLRLTLWCGGPAEERLLARAHPHGTMIAWL